MGSNEQLHPAFDLEGKSPVMRSKEFFEDYRWLAKEFGDLWDRDDPEFLLALCKTLDTSVSRKAA